MTALITHPETLESLSQDILQAWKETHGTMHGQASLMLGQHQLAVLIEDTFTPLEVTLAQSESGRTLLKRYSEGLLKQICETFSPQVAQATARPVVSTLTSLSIQEGWVMCCFKLDAAANTA